jgi:hypothetical protein
MKKPAIAIKTPRLMIFPVPVAGDDVQRAGAVAGKGGGELVRESQQRREQQPAPVGTEQRRQRQQQDKSRAEQ